MLLTSASEVGAVFSRRLLRDHKRPSCCMYMYCAVLNPNQDYTCRTDRHIDNPRAIPGACRPRLKHVALDLDRSLHGWSSGSLQASSTLQKPMRPVKTFSRHMWQGDYFFAAAALAFPLALPFGTGFPSASLLASLADPFLIAVRMGSALILNSVRAFCKSLA